MPTPVTKRNPAQEAKARMILGGALANAGLWAMLTKSTDDDRIVAHLSKVVMSDERWNELAEVLFGE